MNIYALKGHKVRCDNLSSGYEYLLEIARQYLELGKEYVVERTSVDSYQTEVWLQEFPDIAFNSGLFEDAVKQTEADDERHPDYERYH